MKTHQILSVLLTTLFVNVGLANAKGLSADSQHGVKLSTISSSSVDTTSSSDAAIVDDVAVDDDVVDDALAPVVDDHSGSHSRHGGRVDRVDDNPGSHSRGA